MESCVRFISLLAFKGWWRNHLLEKKCLIIYRTQGAFTFVPVYCCYVFSLCCTWFCYYWLVPSNFCCTWKLLLVHLERILWILELDEMFQYFQRTLLIFGRDQPYIDKTSRIFASFEVLLSLSVKSPFLSIFLTAFMCLFISSGL